MKNRWLVPPPRPLANTNGFGLVQVIVSVAIMGILMMTVVSMMAGQSREVTSLTEKLAVNDLTQALTAAVSNSSTCTFQLTQAGPWISSPVPVQFDASTIGTASPPSINLNQVLAHGSATAPPITSVGSPASPISGTAIVSAIQVTNINGPVGGNTFTANLQVNLDQTRLVRGLKPSSAQVVLQTSGAGNIKTVTACQSVTPTVRVASGTVTHDATITPIPGYLNSECQVLVTMEDAHVGNPGGAYNNTDVGDPGKWGDNHWGGSQAYVNAAWSVTCQYLFTYSAWFSGGVFSGSGPNWYPGNCRYLMTCTH